MVTKSKAQAPLVHPSASMAPGWCQSIQHQSPSTLALLPAQPMQTSTPGARWAALESAGSQEHLGLAPRLRPMWVQSEERVARPAHWASLQERPPTVERTVKSEPIFDGRAPESVPPPESLESAISSHGHFCPTSGAQAGRFKASARQPMTWAPTAYKTPAEQGSAEKAKCQQRMLNCAHGLKRGASSLKSAPGPPQMQS